MNKNRKKHIIEIIEQLKNCLIELGDIGNDEIYTRDNIPENLQGGETYLKSEEFSDIIDYAIAEIESAISSLEEI